MPHGFSVSRLYLPFPNILEILASVWLRQAGITSDQIIEVSQRWKSLRLRRVDYYDQDTKKHYAFLTNHFRLSAKIMADIYKERWQIEIFFREIKQNLRIKSFVGNSEKCCSDTALLSVNGVPETRVPEVHEQTWVIDPAALPTYPGKPS